MSQLYGLDHGDGEIHCPGCNWSVCRLFSIAASAEEAQQGLDKDDEGMCAECICNVLESAEITLEPY